MSTATANAQSDDGVLKWTPIQEGRFYLEGMKRMKMTLIEYFGYLVEECDVDDTAEQHQHFCNCLHLATAEAKAAEASSTINLKS